MKFQSDLNRCGDNLRHLREKQRMTIDALAVLSGIPADMISRFEKGEGGDVAIADLLKLAEVLNARLSDIITSK